MPPTSRRTDSAKIRMTAIIIFGHSVAITAYTASPAVPGISESWLLQFSLMGLFSMGFLAAAVWIPRASVRPVLLSVVIGFHLMAELPLGDNAAPMYALGATYIFVALRSFANIGRFIAVGAYAIAVAFIRGSVAAWDIDLPAPTLLGRLLFLLFAICEVILLEQIRESETRADVLERKVAGLAKNIDALAAANIDFQEYATRVQREAQQEERNRIAREIHDIIGYTLMNLQMMMEAALDKLAKKADDLPALLTKARDHTQRSLLETRNAMRSLRALEEPEISGLRGLHELTRIFENATRVKVEFNPGNFPDRFDTDLNDLLRRLLQESLTNSFRHGNAETVVVNFWKTEDSLRVAIYDDGTGSQNIVPGIGITGMRERLAALGGALMIRDGGKGFGLVATIPYPYKEIIRERSDQSAAGG